MLCLTMGLESRAWAMATLALGALAFGASSCSKGSDPQVLGRLGAEKATAGKGCVQGVVIDGFSGQKIDLVEKKASIFVLVNSGQVKASLVTDKGLTGEYYICGVPVEQDFPIYVTVEGFEQFYGSIQIDSTVPQLSSQASEDLKKQVPTLLGNVRLFPKGSAPQNLAFSVFSNGVPVSGAVVKIKPTGTFKIPESDYIAPSSTRMSVLNATTDASGTASFEKENLTLGMSYSYVVFPPNGGSETTTASDSFFLGLDDAADSDSDTYKVIVNLSYSKPPLAIVSTSRDSDNINANGELRVVFNRDIEIVPGTLDGITAVLGNLAPSSKLDLADDVKGNNAAESAVVNVSGNTLTLTPKFESALPAAGTDPAVVVTYTGIQVRPVASPKNDEVIAVDTALSASGRNTVSFFGGAESNLSYASSVQVLGEQFFDTVAAGGANVTPSVTVKDKNGNLLSNVPVTWSVEDGAGFIGTDGLVNTTVNTNASGVSSATWFTSRYGGYYKAMARVGNLDPVVFFRNVTGIKEFKIESAATSGSKGGELGAPVVVTVTDHEGQAVVGTSVTFFVEEDAGSIDTATANSGSAAKEKRLTVNTDAQGQAKVFWTLGAAAGQQKIYAKISNYNALAYSATAE